MYRLSAVWGFILVSILLLHHAADIDSQRVLYVWAFAAFLYANQDKVAEWSAGVISLIDCSILVCICS